jgi:hypothetical protein
MNQRSLCAEDVQKLLGADEALIFWIAADQETQVFALTRDGFDWKSIPLGSQALARKIASSSA